MISVLRSAMFASMMVVLLPQATRADVSTLTLDGLSFISFNDQVSVPIPSGTIRFNFGATRSDGTTPFSIDPADVSFSPVSIPGSETRVEYVLTAPTTGTMVPTSNGKKFGFIGTIAARDVGAESPGQRSYVVQFTTEVVAIEDSSGETVLTREGFRIPSGAQYVQIVGGTVSQSENREGDAVYVVLSGNFDHIP